MPTTTPNAPQHLLSCAGSSQRTRWFPLHVLACVLVAGLALAVAARPASAQTLTGLSLNPTEIAANASTTATLTLSGPAPAGGASVCLSSSYSTTASVTMNKTVTVPEGSTQATFAISGTASVQTTLTILASYGSSTVTAALTIDGTTGGGGGGGNNYLYEVHDVAVQASAVNLRLGDIFMPKTMQPAWDAAFVGSTSTTYEVQRNGVSLGTTTNTYWPDAFDFASGTTYTYSVRVLSGQGELGLPPPPQGADPNTIAHLPYENGAGPWVSITVTPFSASVGDNQTVDSRYDLRYSTYVYKDFQFKNGIYRGGLFVGFGNDPGRVARSFLKFSLPSVPQGQYLWLAGTLNLYYTRSLATGTTTIGAQEVPTTWDQATLKWSAAPALTPSSASKTFDVSYDGTDASSGWKRCDFLDSILGHLWTDQMLGAGLASTNENTAGWAYFAKKEWNGADAACLLFAYGYQLVLYSVTVSPNPVQGGQSTTGTVTLNGPAPSGGLAVTVRSSNPSVAMVGACDVVIPAGQNTATFPITTSAVGSQTQVTIIATYQSQSVQTTLTVTP